MRMGHPGLRQPSGTAPAGRTSCVGGPRFTLHAGRMQFGLQKGLGSKDKGSGGGVICQDPEGIVPFGVAL
jgi:hypothetical protein